MLLGDRIENALDCVGINSDKVSKWLGRPCGCPERKERINQLHSWALRVLRGVVDDAEVYLDKIIEEEEEDG